jgi:hypothetical protein
MPNRPLTPGRAALLAIALPTFVATAASAQPPAPVATKIACVQASDKAQQLRVAGKLLAARDTLRICVQDSCPGVVREACAQWLNEVQASLPSIVIGAKDADGKDLLDLKVSIDGALVTEHLGGLAVSIDPGRHKMKYEKPNGAVLEEEILVGEGAKNREVAVVFPGAVKPVGAAASTAPSGGATQGPKGASTFNTAMGTVFGVVGAGALGAALYLDLSATSDVNDLKQSACAKTSTCPSSRVNQDELDYDLAGVGLGVGIVAVGVAVYVFVAHPFGDRPASGTSSGTSFRVVPSPHGSGFALTF